MATWEDGPEYAPLVRPDEFALPDVAPLDVAEPYVQPAAGAPVERPSFGGPQSPVIALADLVPEPEEVRDPTRPYDVAATLVTGDSAWGAVHSRPPTSPISTSSAPWLHTDGPQTGSSPVGGAPMGGTPAGGPLAGGAAPGGYPGTSPLPAPGTPQWFGPAPYQPVAAAPVPVTAKDVVAAVTPALIIVLGLGGLIHPVAPVTLLVAWALSSRATVAKKEIQIAFVAAVAFVAVLGLFLGFADALDFADWWSGLAWVALVASWAMIAVVLVLAARALRAGRRPAPRPGNWG